MIHPVDAVVRVLSFRWSLAAKRERLLQAFVWVLPHNLVYWCAIRVWASATTGKYGSKGLFDLSADDIIRRWERRDGGDPSFR